MAWRSVTGAVIGGGIVLALTAVAAPIVLPAIGFGTGGVMAGSVAAAAQSAIGNVAAGSLFATLQSLGAVGGFSMELLVLLRLPEVRQEQELALEQR